MTVVTVLGLTAGASPAATTGQIGFVSSRGGVQIIHVTNVDGSGMTAITPGLDAVWSPRGDMLAFRRYEPSSEGNVIYVSLADGTHERRIAPGADVAWSPDGKRLAYTSWEWAIRVVDPDGSSDRRISADATDDVRTRGFLPSWSPDGTRLAFMRINGLSVIDLKDGVERSLTTTGADPYSLTGPQWAPDGRLIAYAGSTCCASASGWQIRSPTLDLVDPAGGPPRTLARGVDDFDRLAWSPDGMSVAYTAAGGGDSTAVFVVSVGSGEQVRIPYGAVGESASAPAWSPDGTSIAFIGERHPASLYATSGDVYVTSATGQGSPRALTNPFPAGASYSSPRWLPFVASAPAEPSKLQLRRFGARVVTRADRVFEVSAAGPRATSVTGGAVVGWTPPRTPLPIKLGNDEDCSSGLFSLVLVRTHLAFFCEFRHGVVDPVSEVTVFVRDVRTGRTRAVAAETMSLSDSFEEHFGPLDADGKLMAFNWKPGGRGLYRVDLGARVPTAVRIATGVALVDVGAGTIAGWSGPTTLVFLDRKGRRLGSLPLRRNETEDVEVDAGRAFVLERDRLVRYDVRRAVLTGSWTTARSSGPGLIVGVSGNLVAYVTGAEIHVVNLSSRVDMTLDVPRIGPPVDAALTSSGLFASYNATHVKKPGRLMFVTRAELLARSR